jgi:protein-S-isoprenylcysteine O-methyltransferase Ste14
MADEPPAPRSPWVFRNRSLLIALAFLVTAFGGRALASIGPFPGLVGTLSLPADLFLQGREAGAPPPAHLLPLLVPLSFGLAGFLLRWWGTSYLRGHIMADRRMHSDRLIVAGPFRFVRNPLYLGNILLMVGFGVYFPPPAVLIGLVTMAAVGATLAHVEARGLRAQHGAAYDAYAQRVHAFVPTFRPVPATATVAPDWRNGLASEAWSLVMLPYMAAWATGQYLLGLALAVVLFAGLIWRGFRNRAARAT